MYKQQLTRCLPPLACPASALLIRMYYAIYIICMCVYI